MQGSEGEGSQLNVVACAVCAAVLPVGSGKEGTGSWDGISDLLKLLGLQFAIEVLGGCGGRRQLDNAGQFRLGAFEALLPVTHHSTP
jgi:hypothetical protein